MEDFVNVGGLRTHFLHAGNGPVLLMIHGQLPGSCAEFDWRDHVSRFADAGFAVYAPDIASFGQTDNPTDFSVEMRIRHMRAIVDHFGFKRYAIWGSSMGAYMACALALEDDRVGDLVLLPSNVLPPPAVGTPAGAAPTSVLAELMDAYKPTTDKACELLQRVLSRQEAITDERVRLFAQNSTGKNEEAHRARLKAPRPKALHPELHKLRNRALLLWGADEYPERALLLQRAYPGSELHFLSHCRHLPQVEYPERSFELVRAFLA
jgi:pimeloyl-ACP methyl ester carboxylesterase